MEKLIQDLIELCHILVFNAEIGPDPKMQGYTDAYIVPIDDIDNLRVILNKLKGQGDEKRE